MRHVYECPVRWADLDLLGHVNNVVYVDYLQEARVDMLLTHAPDERSEQLAEGVVVVRHEVDYLAPLSFDFRPVRIESWVTEVRAASFTMAYEVFHDGPDGPDASDNRVVYVRASTVLTPYVFATGRPRRITPTEREALYRFLEPMEPPARGQPGTVPRTDEHHYPVHVRFSDVDVYGHVNNVKYFEYLQEARILLLSRLRDGMPGTRGDVQVFVARTEVDYRVPILFRPVPYDAWSAVARVGRTSMVVESEICDGETLLSRARVVLVFVDPRTNRPVSVPERVRRAARSPAEAARPGC